MLSAWAGNDVGTSTWLVSVQFQNSAKGIWGKQGHEEHSSSALQGENPLVKGIISFSCSAPKLIAGKAWYIQGCVTAVKWPYGGCCTHVLFLPKSTCGKRKRSQCHAECRDGAIPSAHAGTVTEQSNACESGWNTDTCHQMDEVKWNWGHSLKMHQGRYRLDIRKKIFMERMKHPAWTKLCKGQSTWGTNSCCVDKAGKSQGRWWMCQSQHLGALTLPWDLWRCWRTEPHSGIWGWMGSPPNPSSVFRWGRGAQLLGALQLLASCWS